MTRIAFLLAAFLPLAVAAQMYKWVDEKGVTHYSETPPPDGKANKIDIKSSGPDAPSGAADWKQKELDARQQRIQKEQQEQQQKTQEQNVLTARQKNCVEAQRQLANVQAARPVFTVDEKGEKVFLDDKDREREIDGWKANVRKYCE
jgi:Domain of unknown function (DUF4124)